MKTLFLSCFLFSLSASAATLSFDSDVERSGEKLASFPREFLGLMVDAGVQPYYHDDGTRISYSLNDLSCVIRGNYNNDGELAGVPSYECGVANGNARVRIGEARGFVRILGDLEQVAEGKVFFTDCAMGRCYASAKRISCTIDTGIEEFGKGRFACEVTDGQE